MMNIISIINNKGGVGKTTITQNLGVCMAKNGYKTAVIDFDAQANLSYSIKHTLNKDLGSLLLKKTPITISRTFLLRNIKTYTFYQMIRILTALFLPG
jgi:cellulose biosynthesis protein BcsQ